MANFMYTKQQSVAESSMSGAELFLQNLSISTAA
jgi:hypothetical protein